MSSPFNWNSQNSSQDFSRHVVAHGVQQNADASRRALRNHQTGRTGGTSGVAAFFGGLLALGFLIVVVLVAISLLGL